MLTRVTRGRRRGIASRLASGLRESGRRRMRSAHRGWRPMPRHVDPMRRRVKLNAWGVASSNLLQRPDWRQRTRVVARGWDRGSVGGVRGGARERARNVVTKFGNLPPMTAHLELGSDALVDGKARRHHSFQHRGCRCCRPRSTPLIDSLRSTDAIVMDVRGNFRRT